MERDDDFVRDEEAAAAAEARNIGGDPGRDPDEIDPDRLPHPGDPAFKPVYEAGGGEAEGFEQSEALLEARATDTQQPSPWVDREQRVDEEARAVQATTDTYGEGDHFHSSQVDTERESDEPSIRPPAVDDDR